MKTWSTVRVVLGWISLLTISPFLLMNSGCGHRGGVVGETKEYSYEDVQAQIRAEEAVAEAQREGVQ